MNRLALAFALVVCLDVAVRAEPAISVYAQPVPLNDSGPGREQIGELTFRGGLVLRSSDPRFGGFSGLHVSADGAMLVAVSDRGSWLTLGLAYDPAGRLVGIGKASIGALIGENGKELAYRDTDAEALTVLEDGSMLVAFERNHRILRYPSSSPPFAKRPTRLAALPGFEPASPNTGVEALAAFGEGSLIAIGEFPRGGQGALTGWIGRSGVWEQFAYATRPGFRVSDAGLMPGGDLLILEHHYSFLLGTIVRLVRVPQNAVAGGRRVEGYEIAQLKSPVTTENFEGVSIRRGNAGETLVYILSDDNFNPRQRTLLFMFGLRTNGGPN